MEANLNELELKVLHEISQVVGQALNLDQALQAVLAILSDSLAMQRGTVTLKDPEDAFGFACRLLLGPGALGLMIASILAANMSTCSAMMVDSASAASRAVRAASASVAGSDWLPRPV